VILDSSAVIAVLFRERRRGQLEIAMDAADSLAIGAPTVFETEMVALRLFEHRGPEVVEQFLLVT
jgi:uncharacterized protein with PIN domain